MKRFNTFEGVFTPTFLTIIGVILYLRLGWVVGSVGLLGAIAIIVLSHIATLSTGLCIASLSTNTRVGAGGFYSLVSRYLGLEAGGAIGIPLYISQALSAALYVIGFTEVWTSIFPLHDVKVVGTIVVMALLLVAYIGANIAMKVQFVFLGIICLSILSFALGIFENGKDISFDWVDKISDDKNSFWSVFAVFFPAVTGIGAGAAMSGDLKNPAKSLPLGILTAVAVGLVVYILVAMGYASVGSHEGLISNPMLMAEKAKWYWLVVSGVMGAAISSALGSMLGAPRILMALGEDKLIPLGKFLEAKNLKGEPRSAILFTGIIVEGCLLMWDLNTVASLLTMFFLITYGTINAAVFIEKAVGVPSFRPTFNIPLIVPFLGFLWCTGIMFIINPIFALISSGLVVLVYMIQLRRNLKSDWGDIRSGLFSEIAEWAAKIAARLPKGQKNWKPNFLVPVENPKEFLSQMDFIKNIVFPSGTLRLFSIFVTKKNMDSRLQAILKPLFKRKLVQNKKQDLTQRMELEKELEAMVMPIQKVGIFATHRVIETNNFLEGFSVITQIMKGTFFPPNIVFLTMSSDRSKDKALKDMLGVAIRSRLGVVVLSLSSKLDTKPDLKTESNNKSKERGHINIWIREGSPNLNLSMLMAMLLERNWEGNIRMISVVRKHEEVAKRVKHLDRIVELGRMPRSTEKIVLIGDFNYHFRNAPVSDISIFGAAYEIDLTLMHDIAELSQTPCLFVKESGEESAMV